MFNCESREGPPRWSVSAEWCDFSVSPPRFRGTYYDSSDCSTPPRNFSNTNLS